MRMMALHGSDNNGYANARTTYLFRTKDSRMAAVWQGGVLRRWCRGFQSGIDAASDTATAWVSMTATLRCSAASWSRDRRRIWCLRKRARMWTVCSSGANSASWAPPMSRQARDRLFRRKRGQTDERAGQLFPAGSQVYVMDASQNEQRLVVLVTSDVNPGTYYLYDKGTHQLSVLPECPLLAGMKLSPMQPITITTRCAKIPAYQLAGGQ
jgi:hypothetical protein